VGQNARHRAQKLSLHLRIKGPWRLVYYPREMFPKEYPDGFGELYHLDDDPWEMRNLYFEPGQQARVRELERDLMDWLVTTTRPVTVHPLKPYPTVQGVTRYHHTVNADGKTASERIRAIRGTNYV